MIVIANDVKPVRSINPLQISLSSKTSQVYVEFKPVRSIRPLRVSASYKTSQVWTCRFKTFEICRHSKILKALIDLTGLENIAIMTCS